MKFRASIFPSIKSRGAEVTGPREAAGDPFPFPSLFSGTSRREKSWLQVRLRLEVGPLSRG